MKPTLIIIVVALSWLKHGPLSRKIVTGTAFELTNYAAPFHPGSYIAATIDLENDCPGKGHICGIVVSHVDIYTTGPNIGKPKVDINTFLTDELSDDISAALSNSIDPTYNYIRERVIFEME